MVWVRSPYRRAPHPYGIIRWIVLPSVLFSMPGRRNPRLRPRFLLVSKWRRLVRLCLTLPVLLKVKRLAALREVLILGISLPSLSLIAYALNCFRVQLTYTPSPTISTYRGCARRAGHHLDPAFRSGRRASGSITCIAIAASAVLTYCALPSGSARPAARYPLLARRSDPAAPAPVPDELSGGRETKSRA